MTAHRPGLEPNTAASNTKIMGVLNVTPDSFSDGGAHIDPAVAIEHARRMAAEGAHLIDVGGESTRPGADRVSLEEEQRRVLPVIRALSAEGIIVSIDTINAETARLAVEAGASIINDVSGGIADPNMRRVAADTGADFVIMHWRGIPDPAHSRSEYVDVVTEVCDELKALAAAAIEAGVGPEQIILDPGLGFDKTTEQGWQLLAGLPQLTALGHRVLIGVSRKRMLAETLRDAATTRSASTTESSATIEGSAVVNDAGKPPTVSLADRDLATATVSAHCATHNVWAVRVHDVASSAIALTVAEALAPVSAPTAPIRAPIPASTAPIPASTAPVTDRITLTGLEVFAHHGVFDFERQNGQRFLIDADLSIDLRSAAKNDDLARTVNYAQLASAILAAASTEPVDLIETLAERAASVALGFEGVTEVRITVHKPDAPIDAKFEDVSVSIVRQSRDLS